MPYEAVVVTKGETLGSLVIAYGIAMKDASTVWDDPRNKILKAQRVAPDKILPGDILMISIPWRVKSQTLSLFSDTRFGPVFGVSYMAKRDGGYGTRLSWVQTVYQSNQPAQSTTQFCVDGCPADDDLPFYWTETELKVDRERRKTFSDVPRRAVPTKAIGTTTWRAITSIAVVTGKRVSVYDSYKWGFDLSPAGVDKKIGPLHASPHEIKGHLHQLRTGRGTGTKSFGDDGWSFVSPAM